MTQLTPEERRRIYEEEKARIERETREEQLAPPAPDPVGTFLRGPGGAILVAGGLLLVMFLMTVIHVPPPAGSTETTSSALSSGSTLSYTPPSETTSIPAEKVETPPPPPAREATWHTIKTFKGESSKNTETFTITGDEWRIQWATRPGEYGDGNFQIYVEGADGSPSLTGGANIIGKGSDVSYEHGAGHYYLSINTMQPYGIVVEELR